MEGTSVIRQETFDVDPSLTLRSRSGGVKRGSIALPIIGTDTYASTPPIKETSFESADGELNSKPNTKIQRRTNAIKARPSTYNLNEEARDKQNKLPSDDLKSGNSKKNSTKQEGRKTEYKNVGNVIKINENKSEQANPKLDQGKLYQVDENRYEDVNSLEEKVKKAPSKNKEKETNTSSVISNRDAQSKTQIHTVDVRNRDTNKVSSLKKENKSNTQPDKESKEKEIVAKTSKKEESKDKVSEKSPKNNKVNKTQKSLEKSDRKESDQQNKPSQTKSNDTHEKSLVQRSARVSNDITSQSKSNVLKNNKKSSESKNKNHFESSVIPDNKTSAEKELPASAYTDDSVHVVKSSKRSFNDAVGPTGSKNDHKNTTDTSVKAKTSLTKDGDQKSEINKTKEKEDRSVRQSSIFEKEKYHSDASSSQESKIILPNKNTTSSNDIDNTVISKTDRNKHLSKIKVPSRDSQENHNSKQVKFDVDVSDTEADTLSIDLIHFDAANCNSNPPKSTTLANERTQDAENLTESSRDNETVAISDGLVSFDSAASKTTAISAKRRPQDTKASDLKTEKRDDSHSQKYLKPAATDKESNNSEINFPNSVYRGRSPKAVDSVSLQRYSVSPDKHYHGHSSIFSPEKPYYDEKRNRRSMMDSPSRKSETSTRTESYDAVYAERKTLLDAEVTYKKRIKQLEDELNQFLRTIEDLRAENKILRSKIDSLERSTKPQEDPVSHQSKNTVVIDTEKIGLEGKIEDLEKENKELNQRFEESGVKVKLAMSENKQLSDKYEEAFWKNKELEEKCIDLENRLRNMKESSVEKDDDTADLKKMKDENVLLKSDLEKLTSDIEKANTKSKSAIEENKNLKKELEDSNKFKTQLESLQKELEVSQKDEARAKSQFEKLKFEFDQIKLDGDEAKNKEIEKLKAEVVNLKIELKRMEAEKEKYKELTTPRPDDDGGKQSPNTETMTLKSQVISLQTENQTLNEEIIRMKADHLETVKKMHDLEKTAKSYEKSVTDVESEKISQIQDLENQNAKLKAENKSLNESLNQKKLEIQELMSAMNDDKFEDEIKQAKEDREQSLKELEGKANEINAMKKEMEEFKMKYDILEKEKKKEDESILVLSKINEDKKKEIDVLKAELDEIKKDLEMEKDKSTSLKETEKEMADAKSKVSKLEKDIENLKIKHEKEVKNLNDAHEQENEEWRKKYISLEKENKEEILHLKGEIVRLKAEIAKLEGLREAAKDLEDTRKDLVTLQGRVSELTIEIEQRSQVDERNFEMSLKIETLNKKIRELENDNKTLSVDKDIAGDFEASNKKLSEENKKLRFKLDEKSVDKKMEILERKQKDNETRVKQLEGWVGDLYEEKPETNASKRRQKKQPFSKAVPTVTDKKSTKRPRSLDEVQVKVEEDKVTTHSSTPSLPNIFESEKKPLTFGLGYSQIYKNRMKAISKYKKS